MRDFYKSFEKQSPFGRFNRYRGRLVPASALHTHVRTQPLNFHHDYAPQRASICPRCHNPIGGDGGGFCSDLCTDRMPLEILADLEVGALPYGFMGDDEPPPETRLPGQGLSSTNDPWYKARRYLRTIPFPFTVLPEA